IPRHSGGMRAIQWWSEALAPRSAISTSRPELPRRICVSEDTAPLNLPCDVDRPGATARHCAHVEPVTECGGHVENGLETRVPVTAQRLVKALAAEARATSQLCHASRTGDGAERRDDGRRLAFGEYFVEVSDDRLLV